MILFASLCLVGCGIWLMFLETRRHGRTMLEIGKRLGRLAAERETAEREFIELTTRRSRLRAVK